MSQRHYTLTLLEDAGILGCRPNSVPMDPSLRLCASSKPLYDPIVYRCLVGHLLSYYIWSRYHICSSQIELVYL